ncbi:hypothetical protein UFOVP891_61 [uncultured Caudovirales phage]|uniref:Uncharacterized protein n=1 Tax=uncultured Caudovirales phage TaxID=2100421 RepID=A0A6J5T2U6_9CAUD|nr:hypothetical protein UFOVP472_6 [uncultured Caudovirales phage]CAB4169242.1 hypothetical protein UFOVP891_61 [uncultured Caudovirales phage]CAB4180746.1 hypothetical protein UFOVP1053_6 [uncultured Caudovirales phage]CAB4195314.1 hypothetical protein UFOVP1297_5 [uncultured Caudovirales phage]CAB4221909.1 hypothetical protein UFOVP1647_45 [uncultured Caudovirales phage]
MAILFTIRGPHLNLNPAGRRGVPPDLCGAFPLPAKYFAISGVTKDSAGTALAACVVDMFNTVTDVKCDSVTSDAAGVYESRALNGCSPYYAVAYKAGSPDVAGTTVNTLTAV